MPAKKRVVKRVAGKKTPPTQERHNDGQLRMGGFNAKYESLVGGDAYLDFWKWCRTSPHATGKYAVDVAVALAEGIIRERAVITL